MPVLSVIPLGRVCGRGPSVLLPIDRWQVEGVGAETGLVMVRLEMSFIDAFRARRLGRVFSISDWVL